MLNSVDPKFRPWKVIQKEFEILYHDEPPPTDIARKRDSTLCLSHGFHLQKSYTFTEGIRCTAYRSNVLTDEFIVNSGFGNSNVLQLSSFRKDIRREDIEQDTPREKIGEAKNICTLSSLPPMQHLVWISKYRLFVGICSDKNMRVFSDTRNRCQIMSAPTCCPMPVLSMVYLEETDEVVTGGIGIIQPWKMRFSNVKSGEENEVDYDKNKRPLSRKKNTRRTLKSGGKMPGTSNINFGTGRQMLQPRHPYECDLIKDDWVLKMRVYNSSNSKESVAGGSKHVLVATCADVIIAIDYMKREQIWSVRLHSPLPFVVGNRGKEENSLEDITPQALTSNYVIKGHVSFTVCDFFPRFGYFITGGGEGMIQIMHMVNFGTVTTLLGHRLAVTGLVAHSKHPIMISSSKDGSIRIWCLETFRENQRIDTCQLIENISLSDNSNSFYLHSKRKISLYYYHNLYSLYSIPHSTAAALCPVSGDASHSFQGRILAALADGSVALLSPNTGLMLTMIYPMTTFQVFTGMAFDIYSGMSYIRLQDGSILQCDCTTNPSVPLQRFVPAIPFDEDACSLASIRIRFRDNSTPITVVLAGLCNGQIILVRPNSIWISNVQAHAGPVRFLITIENALVEEQENASDYAYCQDQVYSIGASSIRIWKIVLKKDFNGRPPANRGKVVEFEFSLQPVTKVFLPEQCLHPTFVAAMNDRLCLAREDSYIVVIEINSQSQKSDHRKYSYYHDPDIEQKIQQYLSDEDERKLDFSKLSQHEKIAIEAALHNHRLSTDITKSMEHLFSLMERSSFIHTHHPEDDHRGKITALSSAQGLRFFASSSTDGYVKIWDEMNRLLRELCFLPNPVTAISFVNGRDLLVALEGRIYAIECSTFLTKSLITERRIADLHFEDMDNEAALKYDNDIQIISKIENLSTLQLFGNMRQLIPDEISEMNARRVMTAGKCTTGTMKSSKTKFRLPSPDTLAHFNRINTAMLKKKKSESIGNKRLRLHAGESITYRWKDIFSKINTKIKRGSIDIISDEEKAFAFLKKNEGRKYSQDNRDIHAYIFQKPDADRGESGNCEAKSKHVDNETDNDDDEQHQKTEFPIAPDGYVPNSVIRQLVIPPVSLPEVQNEIWKLQDAPENEVHWATSTVAEASAASLGIEESSLSMMQSSMVFGKSELNLLNADSILQQYYLNQQKEDLEEQYDEDDDDFTELEKYSRQTDRSGKDIQFRKLGNTMNKETEKERVQVTFEQRKGGKGRVPKYTSQVRGLNVDQKQAVDEDEEEVELVPSLPAKESFSAMSAMMQDTVSAEMGVVQPRKAPSAIGTKADMKAKLLKKRTDKAKEKNVAKLHPLLEEITKALWFRKKLSAVTAETVANALLEMGNTTRVAAHQKACESLTRLITTFGPNGKDKGQIENILSDNMIERIRLFVASYLTPRFSMTGVENEDMKRKMEEEKKKNPNRVQLAHNALDAINSGLGLSEEITCGVLRLAADENKGIKDKAMTILTEKMGIDSWDKLAEKLRSVVGDDVVIPPGAHKKNEKESLDKLLQRVKMGLFTLANAPKMAERLNLVISQRRHSVEDDESRSRSLESSNVSSDKASSNKSSLQKTEIGTATSSSILFKNRKESINVEKDNFVAAGDGDSVSSKGSVIKKTRVKKESKSAEKVKLKLLLPKEAREKKTFAIQKDDEEIHKSHDGGVPFTNFPKINWRKAVPLQSKQTIKMMRTMRIVHATVRTNRRRFALRRSSKNTYSDHSSKSYWGTNSSQMLSSETAPSLSQIQMVPSQNMEETMFHRTSSLLKMDSSSRLAKVVSDQRLSQIKSTSSMKTPGESISKVTIYNEDNICKISECSSSEKSIRKESKKNLQQVEKEFRQSISKPDLVQWRNTSLLDITEETIDNFPVKSDRTTLGTISVSPEQQKEDTSLLKIVREKSDYGSSKEVCQVHPEEIVEETTECQLTQAKKSSSLNVILTPNIRPAELKSYQDIAVQKMSSKQLSPPAKKASSDTTSVVSNKISHQIIKQLSRDNIKELYDASISQKDVISEREIASHFIPRVSSEKQLSRGNIKELYTTSLPSDATSATATTSHFTPKKPSEDQTSQVVRSEVPKTLSTHSSTKKSINKVENTTVETFEIGLDKLSVGSKIRLSSTSLNSTLSNVSSEPSRKLEKNIEENEEIRLPKLIQKSHKTNKTSHSKVLEVGHPPPGKESNYSNKNAYVLPPIEQKKMKSKTTVGSISLDNIKTPSLIHQDIENGNTDQPSDNNDWRAILKKLSQMKCPNKRKRGYDRRQILPSIEKENIVGEAISETGFPTPPGERLTTAYTVCNREGPKTTPITDGTAITALPGRYGTQTCEKSTGESRYGALSFRWTNHPVGPEAHPSGIMYACRTTPRQQNIVGFHSTCRDYTPKTCRDPYPCEARRRENVSVLFRDRSTVVPIPTPMTNYRSVYWDSVINRREQYSTKETTQSKPVSLYQVNSKSFKKLMKSARKLSQKKRLKLPMIPPDSVASGRRSITVRIPPCDSNALSTTPHYDRTD